MAKKKKLTETPTPAKNQPSMVDIKKPGSDGPVPVVTDVIGSVDKKSVPAEPTIVKTNSPMPTRRRWPVWLWIAIGIVVLGIAAGLGYAFMGKDLPSGIPISNVRTNTSLETLVSRQLDGVLVPTGSANPNIYAVMIENASDSRPPSGLDKASVVYEALAEGGITRFMALFPVGQTVPEIGPVRSARQYYVEWAEEYKPLYVHAGGSPEALTYLQSRNTNVIDFNQFRHGPNFIRDKTRRAPHNLYTSTDLLYIGLKSIAPDAVPTYASWAFKDESPLDGRPLTINDIVIDYSSFNYKVTYKYDRALNQYQRFQGETPHVTRENANIYAKNIVVQFTKTRATGDADKRLDIETTGEGKMLMFRDGTVSEGTWKKESVTSRTEFKDINGEPLALNRGTTWIEIIPTDRKVTY